MCAICVVVVGAAKHRIISIAAFICAVRQSLTCVLNTVE